MRWFILWKTPNDRFLYFLDKYAKLGAIEKRVNKTAASHADGSIDFLSLFVV
jgi:hypothetical protein